VSKVSEAGYIKSLRLHRSQTIAKDDSEGITIHLHEKSPVNLLWNASSVLEIR